MAKPRHLDNAPIAEAVIDFRTRTAVTLDVEALSDLGAQLGALYPEKPADIGFLEFGIHQQPGQKLTSSQKDLGKVGYRFRSSDGKHIFQLRKDGFTFSRLSPYPHWDHFFDEASKAYRRYFEIGQLEGMHRIGVRYINRMLLPDGEVGDFSGFLTAPPPFPQEVPALMTQFLTQVHVQELDSLIHATVTQTVQKGQSTPGFVPVILDIDVFQNGNFSVTPDVLLPQLNPLRDFKNRLFFASITEKTADLFA
jgi:uncharacterized protein (TIGR04255 family)